MENRQHTENQYTENQHTEKQCAENQYTISVIVPVYNAQDYLERCVNSITQQTYSNLEIILVDDGAQDASPAMCDAFAGKDSRIHVIHKPNGGLMSAWMAGTRIAGGHFLCYVDSDDWVDTCMMEHMLRHASGAPGEIICCNFLIERPGSAEPVRHELAPGVYAGAELDEKIKKQLLGNERRTVSMSRCMKLFSRELITENMRFCNPKIRMGEDVNIVLPALCDADRVVIMQDAHYYHYYFNPASMVHRYDAHMQDGIRELIGTIRSVFVDKQPENWQEQWIKECVWLTMLTVKNELRGGRSGYAGRIRISCSADETAGAMREYRFSPQDKANRILLWVMKSPDSFRCAVGKAVFWLYDKVKGD